ncbi:MAG TPA: NADH-quinone oxidoreductase subunit A [Tepidisphaeraceae bacterium]|jgi:NADH-quinone oxidoreductase subunit A
MDALLSIVIFTLAGLAFVGVGMTAGKLLRPRLDNPAKAEAYECGELPVGSAQVQFDLRFYIIALVYLIFAVEVVLFYPWAVAYGSAEALADAGQDGFTVRQIALTDMLVFFALLMVGFAYLWRFGYLEWVRSTKARVNP